MFSSAPQAPAVPQAQVAPVNPATQAAPPGNIPAPQVAGQVNEAGQVSGVVPALAPVEHKPEAPLEQFKGLWEPVSTPEGQGQPTQAPELTQESLQQVMGKVDFAQHVTPDTLAAITAGGEGAAAALMQALNSVGQQAMIQSTLVNNKLANQGVATARSEFEKQLPDLLRQQAVNNHAKETNPLLNNPAIKPIAEATQAQLLAKYPNATHAELTEMTVNFIQEMGTAFAPPAPAPDPTTQGQDWNKFINPT